jgi:hypothetical protein
VSGSARGEMDGVPKRSRESMKEGSQIRSINPFGNKEIDWNQVDAKFDPLNFSSPTS